LGGTVLGIDHLAGLVSLGTSNLQADPTASPHLNSSTPLPPGSITNILSDGRLGAPSSYLPPNGLGWDAIHVGAASPDWPEPLIGQLKKGGRMFCPVGPDWGEQAVWQIDKKENGEVEKKRLFGVSYIP
jgi:protein-L-isoaspartate(D-aspartate) O-methyltransferase